MDSIGRFSYPKIKCVKSRQMNYKKASMNNKKKFNRF